MIDRLRLRTALPQDRPALATLYGGAFPDEDLLPLVDDLHAEGSHAVSLVGIVETGTGDNTLVGHAVFTPCRVAGCADEAALLGPLAVAPDYQRQGVGSALVRAGLRHMETAGIAHVYVLGDPAYYGRFGFEPDERVAPPYPLPHEWHGAWQSLGLHGDTPLPQSGTLVVPDVWDRPELWRP